MFDIGFYELALIGILALLVLGPKRLPEAARTAGLWVGKLRLFVAGVKQDINREIESGELDELRRLKDELSQARTLIEESSNSIYGQIGHLGDNIDKDVKGISSPAAKDVRQGARAGALAGKKKSPVKKKTAGKHKASKKKIAKKAAKKKVAKKKSRKRRN